MKSLSQRINESLTEFPKELELLKTVYLNPIKKSYGSGLGSHQIASSHEWSEENKNSIDHMNKGSKKPLVPGSKEKNYAEYGTNDANIKGFSLAEIETLRSIGAIK